MQRLLAMLRADVAAAACVVAIDLAPKIVPFTCMCLWVALGLLLINGLPRSQRQLQLLHCYQQRHAYRPRRVHRGGRCRS